MNEADIQELEASVQEELEDISLTGTFSVTPEKEELYSLDAIITDADIEVLRIQINAEEDDISVIHTPLNNEEAIIMEIIATRGDEINGTLTLTEADVDVFVSEFEVETSENTTIFYFFCKAWKGLKFGYTTHTCFID